MPLDTVLDSNEMFDNAFNWEPKYTNRFIMRINDMPAYLIKASGRPRMTNGEIVLEHINIDRKVKGKSRWNDISITLYDPIKPSAAKSTIEWIRLHHESATGRDGYSEDYKKDIIFEALDAGGMVVEEWQLKGAWILDSNFGDWDWGNEEAAQIELTLKYDWALLS